MTFPSKKDDNEAIPNDVETLDKIFSDYNSVMEIMHSVADVQPENVIEAQEVMKTKIDKLIRSKQVEEHEILERDVFSSHYIYLIDNPVDEIRKISRERIEELRKGKEVTEVHHNLEESSQDNKYHPCKQANAKKFNARCCNPDCAPGKDK